MRTNMFGTLLHGLVITFSFVIINPVFATAIVTQLTDADYKKSLAERTAEVEELMYSYQGKSGPHRRAANLLESVIKEDNTYVPALVQLSRLARKTFNHDKALTYAKRLLDYADELNSDDHELIAQKLYVAVVIDKDNSTAMELINKAVALDINNPWIHVSHAKIYMYGHRFSIADKILQRAVDMGPGNTEKQRNGYIAALFDQANVAYNQSKNDRLLKLAEEATSTATSDNAWVWGNLANLLYRADMIDKGIEYYRKALSIMDYGVARRGLGIALHAKAAKLSVEGEKLESQKVFNEAITYWEHTEQVTHEFVNTDIDYLVEPYIVNFIIPNKPYH